MHHLNLPSATKHVLLDGEMPGDTNSQKLTEVKYSTLRMNVSL